MLSADKLWFDHIRLWVFRNDKFFLCFSSFEKLKRFHKKHVGHVIQLQYVQCYKMQLIFKGVLWELDNWFNLHLWCVFLPGKYHDHQGALQAAEALHSLPVLYFHKPTAATSIAQKYIHMDL